jgi:hypothetical protein
MASEPSTSGAQERDALEMPRPTVAPLVLAAGVALFGAGVVFGLALTIVGALVLAVGLGIWIGQLLPGQGHVHEPRALPADRAPPPAPMLGAVEQLRAGMPGYRLRLPVAVHPTSAGVKGGIVGGLVMPIPALLWGVFSGHGPWYPVNLLAGMVLPGLGDMSVEQLQEFNLTLFTFALVIHAAMSLVIGLLYGVLMPTLPSIPKPLAWGGLLMPLLWTAVTFSLMSLVNPLLDQAVDWPSFILCQFIFGVVAALVFMQARGLDPRVSGVLGGIAGALVMPLPALLWGVLNGFGPWYPVNLLAALVNPGMDALPTPQLQQFNPAWLAAAIVIHAVLSCSIGLANGLLLPRVPPIPAPLAWGGLLLPLVWTALSYSLMGVANPVLQERVSWPWFIVSQFVFGVAAAAVVLRSGMIPIPPAGLGPDRVADFIAGQGREQP